MDYKLVIFDVDGTLGDPPGIDRSAGAKMPARFRKTPDDWQLFPGRKERLAELQAAGVKTAMATNQGGVAFGYLDPHELREHLYKVGAGLGMCSVMMCFTHPKASIDLWREDSSMRKPGPGMLLHIMETEQVEPADTLYVGDRPEDEQAARNAGVAFMWADEFFRSHVTEMPESLF